MKHLEVRRHSKRAKPGQHLTQWGVTLARLVGAQLGPFARVVTSPLPRCVETAVAMGFAVEEVLPALGGADGLGEHHPQSDEINWDAGWVGMAAIIHAGGALARFAEHQAACWLEVVRTLSDGERALIVTHGGGFLSGAAITLLPGAGFERMGAGSGYCEGVLVSFDGEIASSLTALRVDIAALGLAPSPAAASGMDSS